MKINTLGIKALSLFCLLGFGPEVNAAELDDGNCHPISTARLTAQQAFSRLSEGAAEQNKHYISTALDGALEPEQITEGIIEAVKQLYQGTDGFLIVCVATSFSSIKPERVTQRLINTAKILWPWQSKTDIAGDQRNILCALAHINPIHLTTDFADQVNMLYDTQKDNPKSSIHHYGKSQAVEVLGKEKGFYEGS